MKIVLISATSESSAVASATSESSAVASATSESSAVVMIILISTSSKSRAV